MITKLNELITEKYVSQNCVVNIVDRIWSHK